MSMVVRHYFTIILGSPEKNLLVLVLGSITVVRAYFESCVRFKAYCFTVIFP